MAAATVNPKSLILGGLMPPYITSINSIFKLM